MTNHQETTNCDIYREKGRSDVQKAAQWTEFIEEIQKKSTTIDLTHWTRIPTKILKNTTSSFQLLYDEKYIKNCIEKDAKKSKLAIID